MRCPVQAAPVSRGTARAFREDAAQQSGCNWLECGGKIIACAAACVAGPGSAACIACLGSAYSSCKDCF